MPFYRKYGFKNIDPHKMIFKRKIYNKMLHWKEEQHGTTALLIRGARRIGKSTIAEEFAKNKATKKTVREILQEINDEGYKIYKQQGNTFDADNFNWLIAYTMRKHGIEMERNYE